MRIASLVPSSTEMLFALGVGEQVVAVTHECDHPPAVEGLPRLTRSMIPSGLDPAEIDAAVRERVESGQSLYALDTDALERLDVDLIVTQEVCAVCAVAADDVVAIASRLPTRPEVLSLDPSRLGEVLGDALTLGAACGDGDAGRRLHAELAARIEAVRSATADAEPVRVAAIEWLDPPYCAGHWLPEMIEAAGGIDVLADPGERSRTIGWDEIGGRSARRRRGHALRSPRGGGRGGGATAFRRARGARRSDDPRRRRRRLVLASRPATRRRRRTARPHPPSGSRGGAERTRGPAHRLSQRVKLIPCWATMIAATKQITPRPAIVASSIPSVSRREI